MSPSFWGIITEPQKKEVLILNSYFDQQWDQQLADNPEAMRLFSSMDPARQEKIVNYIQSCADSREASARIEEMIEQLNLATQPPQAD